MSIYKNVTELNKTQEQLYRRVLYGFDSISYYEKKQLTARQYYEIMADYSYAQKVINKLKHDVCAQKVNYLFEKLFPNSKFANELITKTEIDYKNINNLTLKELGINRDMIIDKLISAHLLPENFYELV